MIKNFLADMAANLFHFLFLYHWHHSVHGIEVISPPNNEIETEHITQTEKLKNKILEATLKQGNLSSLETSILYA